MSFLIFSHSVDLFDDYSNICDPSAPYRLHSHKGLTYTSQVYIVVDSKSTESTINMQWHGYVYGEWTQWSGWAYVDIHVNNITRRTRACRDSRKEEDIDDVFCVGISEEYDHLLTSWNIKSGGWGECVLDNKTHACGEGVSLYIPNMCLDIDTNSQVRDNGVLLYLLK